MNPCDHGPLMPNWKWRGFLRSHPHWIAPERAPCDTAHAAGVFRPEGAPAIPPTGGEVYAPNGTLAPAGGSGGVGGYGVVPAAAPGVGAGVGGLVPAVGIGAGIGSLGAFGAHALGYVPAWLPGCGWLPELSSHVGSGVGRVGGAPGGVGAGSGSHSGGDMGTTPVSVAEPSSLAVFAIALMAMLLVRRIAR